MFVFMPISMVVVIVVIMIIVVSWIIQYECGKGPSINDVTTIKNIFDSLPPLHNAYKDRVPYFYQ